LYPFKEEDLPVREELTAYSTTLFKAVQGAQNYLYLDVARESTSSRKMMQPGSVSAALKTSDSSRSLSPYHLGGDCLEGDVDKGYRSLTGNHSAR